MDSKVPYEQVTRLEGQIMDGGATRTLWADVASAIWYVISGRIVTYSTHREPDQLGRHDQEPLI